MLTFSVVAVLILVTFATVLLQKTFSQVPPKELKRRAQKGDRRAESLYQAVAYGLSLKVLLWIFMALAAAGLFYAVAHLLIWPLALLVIVILLAIGFTWLPNTRPTALSQWLAQFMAPTLAWLLSYIHVPLQAVGMFVARHASWAGHTNLYQKEDVIDLLEKQEQQTDNRITKQEIDIAVHALTFGDKLVRDIFIPLSQVVSVKVDDSLGAGLMDELHESGHSRFPVYDGKNIVGVLYMHDLLKERQGGSVKTIYQRHVVYAHEEQTLYQTLQAFLKTKRHLFVVVNRFEEVIGVVTIEDVLEQVIGQPIVDEFDQYEDLRAVAERQAAKIHKEQKHPTIVEPEKVDLPPAEKSA